MSTRQVELPRELTFILTDSGERHQLVDGNYNERANECAAAISIFMNTGASVTSLRDVDARLLEKNRDELGDTLYRRCRHVIAENQRVLDTVAALEDSDVPQVGQLLSACQASLRDDFEISCEAIDTLVACANESQHVLGSRMVGGGFGGCVLSACYSQDARAAAADIRQAYAAESGRQPWQHEVSPAHPARIIAAQP
jgi:galactokinase